VDLELAARVNRAQPVGGRFAFHHLAHHLVVDGVDARETPRADLRAALGKRAALAPDGPAEQRGPLGTEHFYLFFLLLTPFKKN
jgi:hypothetical protein